MLAKLVCECVCVHEKHVSKSQRRDVELLVDATSHILHAIDFDISASFMIKSVTFHLTNRCHKRDKRVIDKFKKKKLLP